MTSLPSKTFQHRRLSIVGNRDLYKEFFLYIGFVLILKSCTVSETHHIFFNSAIIFLSSSHENDPILAPILARNVPDSRFFETLREFSIPALYHRQIMWEFMILALFEYWFESVLSSKSAPSVKKPRQLVVFVGLVPTRIIFAGYVIVIFGA